VYAFENLWAAYKRARKGTKSAEATHFGINAENELLWLSEQLKSKTYTPEPYRYFKIFDPKEREISVAAFRDRVVHHAAVAAIEPLFERLFIHHSYATRKGKGTMAAIVAAQKMLRKNQWYLKADIKQYFAHINHQTMLQLIARHVHDPDFMYLMQKIIKNGGHNTGLPIGNLTSQFFANIYLHELDNYVLRTLKPRAYIRYMDDFVLFDNDKQKLKQHLTEIRLFLDKQLSLQLKEKVVQINRAEHGLSFLGIRIYRSTLRINPKNLRRSLKRLRYKYHLYKRNKISEQQFYDSANSIVAHLSQYNSLRLRQNITFWDNY